MVKKLERTKPMKIDIKSRKILYELDINARQSYSQIGKKVGLSKDTVNNKIKKMEAQGIIKGYYTVLDVSKLGYLYFRVFIKLYRITPKKEEEIINYLVKHPKVAWVGSVEGRWDINLTIMEKSVFKFREFWDEFMGKYGDFILNNWVSIITNLIQYKKAFLINAKKDTSEPELIGGELEEKADKTDIKILRILSKNSRTPLLEISKKINLSQKTVAYRIKKMIKEKIILSFRALLDLDLLGLQYRKVHFTLRHKDEKRYEKLLAYTRAHPNIIFVNYLNMGGADFEVEAYVSSQEEFNVIIENMRHKFSELIVDAETLRYVKEYKWICIPLR